MMEGRNYCAVNKFFPFVLAFANRSFGFLKRWDLTVMIFVYVELIGKVLIDHKRVAWGEEELKTLRSDTWKLKSAVEKKFRTQRLLGLPTLKIRVLDDFVDDSKRVRSFSCRDAVQFESFDVAKNIVVRRGLCNFRRNCISR